jgi:hypothetical protein
MFRQFYQIKTKLLQWSTVIQGVQNLVTKPGPKFQASQFCLPSLTARPRSAWRLPPSRSQSPVAGSIKSSAAVSRLLRGGVIGLLVHSLGNGVIGLLVHSLGNPRSDQMLRFWPSPTRQIITFFTSSMTRSIVRRVLDIPPFSFASRDTWFCLNLSAWFINHGTMFFFSHNKSANNTFQPSFSAKRTCSKKYNSSLEIVCGVLNSSYMS